MNKNSSKMINKFVLIIVIVCCLICLVKAQSSEGSSDYDQEEDDEFDHIGPSSNSNQPNPRMMMLPMTGRSKDPDDDEQRDEFENFNEEFEKDSFKEEGKQKSKDDIEFSIQFEDKDGSKEDSSKEKEDEDDKDGFYQTVKDDIDGDFNMYSSNKMNKRIKCSSPDDCREQHLKNQSSDEESSNKTTIVYLTNNPTTSRPNSFTTNKLKYSNRQHEEATNLKAEHFEDSYWNKRPLECDCDAKIQPKIIGGSPAPKSKYPFAVAIFTLVGRGSFCGATIVNEFYILTAAHCVQRHRRVPRNYNIVAGRTDLNVSDIIEEQITKASHIWLNGRLNDVALVRLSHPLEFNNQIKPACFGSSSILPKDYSSIGYNKFGFDSSHFNNNENVSKYFKKTNRTLTAIGWGYVGWKVSKVNGIPKIKPLMTTKLQEVELNEVICTKEEYLICVQGDKKSPCFGDSGSPLLYNVYDKMVVVGLTSRSSSSKARYCLGAPTIYERTSYYLPWIKTLTSNRICLVD